MGAEQLQITLYHNQSGEVMHEPSFVVANGLNQKTSNRLLLGRFCHVRGEANTFFMIAIQRTPDSECCAFPVFGAELLQMFKDDAGNG